MNLDAHLRDELLLPGHLRQPARLIHVVRERLLSIDVQAELHRAHAHRRVHVVGRGNIDAGQLLLLVEQHAPVLVDPQGGKLLLQVVRLGRLDVGEFTLAAPLGTMADGREISAVVKELLAAK